MPGSIKIDDGSGNYTILTNAGSLGSDKTITIPNETATLATTNGITEADFWILTADITGTNADITSNLARPSASNAAYGYLGTGMTESSGIFSFPSTGIYMIQVTAEMRLDTSDAAGVEIYYTNDNFSSVSTNVGSAGAGLSGSGGKENGKFTGSTILDITDTTNEKVKFTTASFAAASILVGQSTRPRTSFTFIRLGDT